jgi:SAM-dependent methyltransferase
MGHASFIIQEHAKPKELICADHTFRLLYLAKKYIAKSAQFICLDVNNPLPFKDNSFSFVLTLDALHYVKNRSLAAREIERVVLSNGCLLALHLHNSQMPFEVWTSLFKKFPVKAFTEKRLVEDFFNTNMLDLSKTCNEQELISSNAISIVGANDDSTPQIFEGVASKFLSYKSHLIINPIYEISCRENSIILNRRFPNEEFAIENPFAQQLLPKQCVIPTTILTPGSRSVSKNLSGEQTEQVQRLMSQFVLINVPQGYGHE